MTSNATANRPPEVQQARKALRLKGWKQQQAAPLLGVTRQHLTLVLTARRRSKRLLAAIQELPENPNPD
jgi:transcriptional regulator